MATLLVSRSIDYSGSFLFNIDTIDFTVAADLTLAARQFGNNGISQTVHMDGSSGVNRVIIESSLLGFDASGFSFANWQAQDRVVIRGSTWNETLVGTGQSDEISGNGGNDTLYGLGGDDILSGGTGRDTLAGGAGLDTLSYRTSAFGVAVDLAANRVTGGDATGDSISGFENAIGSLAADRMSGTAASNRLTGLGAADELTGGGGNDRFIFTALADSGPGARDLITDFSRAQGDRIDLSAIDAVFGLGNDPSTSSDQPSSSAPAISASMSRDRSPSSRATRPATAKLISNWRSPGASASCRATSFCRSAPPKWARPPAQGVERGPASGCWNRAGVCGG